VTEAVNQEVKDDETRKRHLIRLWFRERGRRFYDG